MTLLNQAKLCDRLFSSKPRMPLQSYLLDPPNTLRASSGNVECEQFWIARCGNPAKATRKTLQLKVFSLTRSIAAKNNTMENIFVSCRQWMQWIIMVCLVDRRRWCQGPEYKRSGAYGVQPSHRGGSHRPLMNQFPAQGTCKGQSLTLLKGPRKLGDK